MSRWQVKTSSLTSFIGSMIAEKKYLKAHFLLAN
jgi:hypothetical protein